MGLTILVEASRVITCRCEESLLQTTKNQQKRREGISDKRCAWRCAPTGKKRKDRG